jgi:hypothetical protein
MRTLMCDFNNMSERRMLSPRAFPTSGVEVFA